MNYQQFPPSAGPVGASLDDWCKWIRWCVEAADFRYANLKLKREGKPMTLKAYTIELRVDYDSEEKQKIMEDAAKNAAKHLFTMAVMISDKRKPTIAVHSTDMFAGTEEIELLDDVLGDGDGED